MRILIVEDEYPTAEYTRELCREILGNRLGSAAMVHDLPEAVEHVRSEPVDLCLLDLNLHGENGYDLLRSAVAQAFDTVVISAHADQALEAFRYGVVDFIVKPFGRERLKEVLDRIGSGSTKNYVAARFLSVRENDGHRLMKTEDVVYMKAAGAYVELHLRNGERKLLHKTMNTLETTLPAYFVRTHRSYLVNLNEIRSFGHAGGGTYELTLAGGEVLPLSRSKHKTLYGLFNG